MAENILGARDPYYARHVVQLCSKVFLDAAFAWCTKSAFFSALLMRPSFREQLNIAHFFNRAHKPLWTTKKYTNTDICTKKYVGNKPQWTWWRKRPRGCKPGWGSGWSWPPSWRRTSPTPTGSTERKWLKMVSSLKDTERHWINFFCQNSLESFIL